MKIFHGSYDLVKSNEELTLTIGNFDGMHLGHQQLIKEITKYSDTKSALLTFDPHPSSILKQDKYQILMTKTDKIDYLNSYNLDYLFIVTFNKEFSMLSITDFINFLKRINVKRLVLGKDARFAYRGEGHIMHLKRFFIVETLEDIVDDNKRVSTTLIKQLLSDGNLNKAYELLGKTYQINGNVIHGNSIGTQLGFPTANIDYENYFLPKTGVYHVMVSIDNQKYLGIANVGNNPTINQSKAKSLEVYILDFKKTIYGKIINIEFLRYLREEIKFKSKEELILQIKKDEEIVRSL